MFILFSPRSSASLCSLPLRSDGIFPGIFFIFCIRSAILQLPDLFVSAVVSDEEEPGPENGNDADNFEVYCCPVFMNRVSCGCAI